MAAGSGAGMAWGDGSRSLRRAWGRIRVRYEGSFCRAGSMWARQLMTHLRHWLCIAAIVLMPASALSK